MMDSAGIDVAVLSCNKGFDLPDIDACRDVNIEMKKAQDEHPDRFISLGSVPTLGGAEAMKELKRCVEEYGFPGIAIASEIQGLSLDAPELEPFWAEVSRLGLYVFVHPLREAIAWKRMDADDLGRTLGWEFSLVVAATRLITCGVLDRYPELKVQFAHFAGGLGRYLSRINGFFTRNEWGTTASKQHSRLPQRHFDFYVHERLMYDCAGWAGPSHAAERGATWTKFGLMEVPLSQILFATDYPHAVRDDSEVRSYVQAIKALGPEGEEILSGRNCAKLIPRLATAN
jgi:predicted TIM-barrel fold metal-dependent hydrolase